MTRDNQQEHIALYMFQQVYEHLYDLHGIVSNPKYGHFEQWIQSVLKNCLEFIPSYGYSILAHHSRAQKSPDLVIVKEKKTVMIVEIKPLGFDLSEFNADDRSTEYLQAISKIPWGIVTNGYEWRLYDYRNGGVEVVSFDLRIEDALDLTKSGIQENCKNLAALHVHNYEGKIWELYSQQATEVTSESLVKAMLTADVAQYLSKQIQGNKIQNPTILIDRIYKILQGGMKGTDVENQRAEILKHIKLQKQAGCHQKKSSLKTATEEILLREVSAPRFKKSFRGNGNSDQ